MVQPARAGDYALLSDVVVALAPRSVAQQAMPALRPASHTATAPRFFLLTEVSQAIAAGAMPIAETPATPSSALPVRAKAPRKHAGRTA